MTSRFAWSLTAAVAVYAAIAVAARWLPRTGALPAAVIEIAVIEPEPEPEPETEAEIEPETEAEAGSGSGSVPEPAPREMRRPKPARQPAPELPATASDPAPAPAPAPEPARFAVAMESTVTSPTGVAVPVGRTGADGGRPRSGGRGRAGAGGAGGGAASGSAGSGSAGSGGAGAFRGGRSLPRLVRAVDPVYPAPARRLRIEGRVALRLDIDRDGKVVGARVVRGLGHGLDEAALAAARRLAFAPGTVGGVPTRMSISFSFRFVLDP